MCGKSSLKVTLKRNCLFQNQVLGTFWSLSCNSHPALRPTRDSGTPHRGKYGQPKSAWRTGLGSQLIRIDTSTYELGDTRTFV